MNKNTRDSILIFLIVIAIVAGVYYFIQHESDVDPTFTNIESQSMQHDDRSQIGIIDTGDMIILKNVDKFDHLVSYVEGYSTGYSSFGEYGMVVTYEKDNYKPGMNTIIHRLILYLEYDQDTKHWSAPSLENYKDEQNEPLWESSSMNCNDLYGTLTLRSIGYSEKSVSINLDTLASRAPHSGYLTMGDNAITNRYFDQMTNITVGLITDEQIKAVAWLEIPWIATIKLLMNGKESTVNAWAPNSIPCIAITFVGIIMLFIATSSIILYYDVTKFNRISEKNKHNN